MSEDREPDGSSESVPSPIPDLVPEPTIQDKISDKTIDLVGGSGEDDASGLLIGRRFYVPGHETGDDKYPTLTAYVPKEAVSNTFPYRVSLTFGNQDPRLSTQTFVYKDGTVETTSVDGSNKQILNEEQVSAFFKYLEDIEGKLIPDEG